MVDLRGLWEEYSYEILDSVTWFMIGFFIIKIAKNFL